MPLRLPHAAPSPYLLETVSIRKARPTLNTSIGCIERIVQDGLIIGVTEMSPQTLATVAPTRVKKKASRISRLSHLYCFARRTASSELLAQHGLLGSCDHVVQILLGGMVLCGNPVVEQQLSAGVIGILLEHSLVALLDRRAHLALAHRPAYKLGIIGQIGGHAIDNLPKVLLASAKTAGAKQEDALAVQG